MLLSTVRGHTWILLELSLNPSSVPVGGLRAGLSHSRKGPVCSSQGFVGDEIRLLGAQALAHGRCSCLHQNSLLMVRGFSDSPFTPSSDMEDSWDSVGALTDPPIFLVSFPSYKP